ncbi:MAG: hypothetical protein K6E34_11260 [Lachnospiraceae bacterium]|nr:hypothetical protein [Lachnospiraceae bacterium]
MFINFTNHPSSAWGDVQLRESNKYGDVIDIPFPNVPPRLGEQEIHGLAEEYVEKIVSQLSGDDAVLVQGEFTLCYAVVRMLSDRNIRAVSACTERITEESVKPDGEAEKKSVFRFVRYREYE